MYEDSGDGLDYQDGAYSITKMELNWGEIPVFKINPASNREFVPKQRNWTVSFKGFNRSVNLEIKVNGIPYMAEKQYGQISEMSVSITAKTSDLIEIAVIGDELIYDNACSADNCFDILQNARISMVRKREVMSIIKNKDMSIHRKMVAISDCSREEQHMANAIKEQLILTANEF